MLLPGLLIGPSLDAAVFGAVGWRLVEGDALYAEVWDHKPPGVYLPSVIGHLISLPGESWPVVWLLTVTAVIATSALVARMVKSRGGGRWTLVVACLTALALSSYPITLGGGLGESFAVLPATAGVGLASRPIRGWRWSIVGALVALSTAITIQAVVALFAVAALGWRSSVRQTAASAALAVAGATAVGGVVWLGLASSGMGAAMDALAHYNAAYRTLAALQPTSGAATSWAVAPWVILILMPLVAPTAMAVIAWREIADRRLFLACIGWIVAVMVAILIQGRLYSHYVILLIPPLGIAAGLGISAMSARLAKTRGGSALLGIPVVVLTALSLTVGAAGAGWEQPSISESNEHVVAIAPVIRDLTDPGATIFVWGNEPKVYEAADRTPASKYVYLYPLLTPGYVTHQLVASLADEWAARPPELIIDAGSSSPGSPGLPRLLIDRPVSTDGRDLDLLDPLRHFVDMHYQLVDAVAGWPIYRYRP